MKTVCKKLLCLMLVAMMLVSAVPAAFAAEGDLILSLWVNGSVVRQETNPTQQGFDVDFNWPEESFYGFVSQNWDEYKNLQKQADDGRITLSYDVEKIAAADGNKVNVKVTTERVEQPTPTPDPDPEPTPTPNPDPTPDPDPEPTPTYGTLTVVVRLYNADNQVREREVTFQGQATYTLNYDLAVEAIRKAGFNNSEEFKWQGNTAGTTLTMDRDRVAYLQADPILTPGNREIVTLTINHNRGNGNDDRQTVETLAGTKILDVLSFAEQKDYFDKPSRKGYRLAGYSFDVNCSKDINRDDVINKDMTIYCEWERDYFAEANKYDVTLRVYTNGETRYVDKVLNLEDYAGDGKITRSEVEKLLNKKYSAKSGYYLSFYGLFTAETWDDGDYDPDDAVSTIKVNDYGKTVIYVMVKNVKKAVADSSNPKTGDNIMIAVGTLTLSAAALVSIIELKKRKMI